MLLHIKLTFFQNRWMRDLIFLYELLKILQSLDVELKNLENRFFLQQFP